MICSTRTSARIFPDLLGTILLAVNLGMVVILGQTLQTAVLDWRCGDMNDRAYPGRGSDLQDEGQCPAGRNQRSTRATRHW